METFQCPTRLIAGPGAVSALRTLHAKKLFLVTDPYFAKNGTADRILAAAGAAETAVFDGVRPDPSVELAAAGTARLRSFGPDWVVALGGGSAMDCAKAMVFFAGGDVRLAAVPTTSGSGSEVTDFAILTHKQNKHPLVDPRLRPEIAILDGDLLTALPPGLIADCGFDVLSHALEACVATGAGAVTDALARDAFAAAFSLLPASFAGDAAVRLRIHLASAMAGMAFTQAGLGICHALSHALGGAFHVPHGRLNAILLPAVVECNAAAVGHRYAELARHAGLGATADTVAVHNLKNGLIRLRRTLALPDTLAQAGVSPRDLHEKAEGIVAAALADPCCGTNPVAPDAAGLRRILEAVAGHG